MSKKYLFIISTFIIFVNCKGNGNSQYSIDEKDSFTHFGGSYKKFDDGSELHIDAALKKGIEPMQTRKDTIKYINKMIRLPMELDLFKVDKLTYSVPLLVEDASRLLVKIGVNFRDSLQRKKLPAYKLLITSVTRTQEDVDALTKRNSNASENSAHCYGTTFDISWKRFVKIGVEQAGDPNTDKLKLILAEVLHDLRERSECYVVHERKQACFHITVR